MWRLNEKRLERDEKRIGHVRYVSPPRDWTGSNTPSRGRVVAGATLAPASGKNGNVFSSHLFSIFCFGNGTDLCSLYLYHLQVWKRWNLHSKRRGKWVKASLMLVNRTRRRKNFLELAIWEVFYRRKPGLVNVDKRHVLQQLCSVSVDFQQLEGSISLLKKT